MSPYELDILLHFYANRKFSQTEAPLFAPTITMFRRMGVVIADEKGFKLTSKGRAWVTTILQTPVPKETTVEIPAFIDQQGNVINPTIKQRLLPQEY